MIRKSYDKDVYGVIYIEHGAEIVPVLTARHLLYMKWDTNALKKIKHIKIGGFENYDEALNAVRYTKTKFFRFILHMIKLAQFDPIADICFFPAHLAKHKLIRLKLILRKCPIINQYSKDFKFQLNNQWIQFGGWFAMMSTGVSDEKQVLFGEVFTPAAIVFQMVLSPDIYDNLCTPDKHFIDPCVGPGQFPCSILFLRSSWRFDCTCRKNHSTQFQRRQFFGNCLTTNCIYSKS